MYFYVDETGHTGPKLFDPAQPVLSYGVLSSPENLDEVAEFELAVIRKKLGCTVFMPLNWVCIDSRKSWILCSYCKKASDSF